MTTSREVMRWPRVICMALAASSAVEDVEGQSGRITYEKDVALDIELPREMEGIPAMLLNRDGAAFSLRFTPRSSLMVPSQDRDGGNRGILVFPFTARHEDALLALLAAWLEGDENIMRKGYADVDDQSVVWLFRSVRKILRVEGRGTEVTWEIGKDSGELLGYRVVRATSGAGEDLIEAWYAPDIPVSSGPVLYGGLPGMILQLSVRGGQTTFRATEIQLDGDDADAIMPPDEGEAVSEEEYRSIIGSELGQMRSALRRMRTLLRGPGAAECSIRNERSRLLLNCFQR